MSFTNDPTNSSTDRVRLMTGDIEDFDEGLTDEVYEFLIMQAEGNEKRAALEALKMLVFKYAKYVTEKTGNLFVSENQKYDHYKELLDRVTKDPSWSFLTAGTPYAGGIDLCERAITGTSNPFVLGGSYLSQDIYFGSCNKSFEC